MIRGPDSRRTKERFPDQLEGTEMPENFGMIFDVITREMEGETSGLTTQKPMKIRLDVVDGFEDVIGREPLGAGLFHNTFGTSRQLAFALSIVSHPIITEAIHGGQKQSSAGVIRKLRDARVLLGLRIIDLGCGFPSFALAAQALGAQAYTVDAKDIGQDTKKKLSGHVVLDLNSDSAPQLLQKATGGKFDMVTENIVGGVPGDSSKLEDPEPETIQRVASTLLESGGYLYMPDGGRNNTFRKK